MALIHRDAYATRIEPGDSFESHQAFMERFDAYTDGGGFDLVLAYLGDQPAGQAWGWPLTSSTRWWDGLSAEPESGFTRDDGTRTFALSELMVRQGIHRRHIARALHDKLLSGRAE